MRLVAHYEGADVGYEAEKELYFEVKSTWDMHRKSRPTYNEYKAGKPINIKALGLPDVYRLYIRNLKFSDGKNKPDFVKLDYDHAFYLVKINAEMQENRIFPSRVEFFSWWNSLSNSTRDYYAKQLTSACTDYRSHTNKFGLNNMYNPITGERAGYDNAKFAMLVTGRFIGKPILENGNVKQRYISGVGSCVAFECINASQDYWRYSPLREWWLFDRPLSTAREIGKYPSGGLYLIRDDKHEFYAQFGEKLVFPFWLPYDSEAYIPVENLRTTNRTTKNLQP